MKLKCVSGSALAEVIRDQSCERACGMERENKEEKKRKQAAYRTLLEKGNEDTHIFTYVGFMDVAAVTVHRSLPIYVKL